MRSTLRALFVLLVAFAPAASGQDHVVQRAWLEDPTNALTLEQVRDMPFAPYGDFLNRGFGASTLWIRVRVSPHATPAAAGGTRAIADDRLILRVRPSFLDEVAVYDPLDPGDAPRLTGDRHPLQASEIPSLSLAMTIRRGDAPRDVYLRVRTTSSRVLALDVLDWNGFVREERVQSLLFGAYLATFVLFFGWCLLQWLATREARIGLFAVRQLLALGWSVFILGYVRYLLGEDYPPAADTLGNVCAIAFVSCSLFFDWLLLREHRPPQLLLKLALALVAMNTAGLALFIAGLRSLALQTVWLSIFAGGLVLFLTALSIRSRSRPGSALVPKRLLVAAYGIVFSVLCYAAAVFVGLVPGQSVTLYLLPVHNLLTGALILVILQTRTYRASRLQGQELMELSRTREAARQERANREEQERLLEMLAHELRTPLSTMRMRVADGTRNGREILQAVADIDGVVERCLQAGRVRDHRLELHPRPCDPEQAVIQAVESCMASERVDVLADPVPEVVTDGQMLGIICSNLIENARKYSEPGSRIVARVTRAPHAFADGVTIAVENVPGGAGWPDPARVFAKYYRAPRAHRQVGSGLGLYISSALARKLGGELAYAPTPTHVRFELRLPVAPALAAA